MKTPFLILFLLSLFIGCNNAENHTPEDMEKWKAEIVQVEQDFNDMARDQGLAAAFHHFAAEDAVLKRNSTLIKGKNTIRTWSSQNTPPNATLSWKPSFVDVSASGDLAYTYGDFILTTIDSAGVKNEIKGVFHTVWKRQTNGQWRYVWD